jgi:hypothetical protein
MEQQTYESSKKAEALQTRNNILTTEYNALHQGFEINLLEVARGNQRISLMENREKQLATLLKKLHEENQSHVASTQMQVKEYERTLAQKSAVAMAAVADKNQMQSRMTQMTDFLQLTHVQLKTVQQQQVSSSSFSPSPFNPDSYANPQL